MSDTIRLYYGRDNDEMVTRLKDYQKSDVDKPIAALEVRETVLDDDVIEAIVDLLLARSITTVQLDDCGAYMNSAAIRMARALGSVKNVRLSEPTFLSHYFLDSLLVSATNLSNLKIQDRFDCQQIEALAKGLKENSSLESLDLSRSRLDSFSILAAGLKENKTLKVLKLRSLGLNDNNIEILLDAIKDHPTLETLDLSFNHCQELDNVASLIGNMSSRPLTELFVGYQNLWQSPKINISNLCRSLRKNKNIKTLSLARNKLTNSDIIPLTTALSCNSTLQKLDLRENLISDEGICMLAQAVESSKSMQYLNLIMNPIEEEGASALLKAIKGNYNIVQVDVDDETFQCRELRFAAALNKGGRCALYNGTPLELWPFVLERINKLNFDDSQSCRVGFAFDLETTSPRLDIDIMHFMVQGPALFEGAVCT